MNNKKYVFDQDLRGHDYVREMELSPEIAKNRQHHCETCARNAIAPNVIQMINGWQAADELRFVGAI